METIQTTKTERQYYIDWLRVLLILSVFLFHIGMIFNNWDWHIKNDVTLESKSWLWYLMVYLGRWRMPLLILISGAGTYFALGKRSPGQYLGERFKRLFLPLTAGIFILVPVQVYIERADQYSSLLNYYPHMFDGIYPTGNFSWHHLWFIAYLFLISLFIAPIINFLRSQKFDHFLGVTAKLVGAKLGANVFLIPIIISQAILGPFFPEHTHALIDDWAAIAKYFIYFLSGYMLLSSGKMMLAIQKNRYYYLIESIIATTVMFTIPYSVKSESLANLVWDISEYTMAWSCGIAVLGFAKKHLNQSKSILRKANEAIYPFYLLHQPVIVVIGYWVISWDLSILIKALIITTSSFSVTLFIYWYLVKPFNALRVIFGMKPKSSKRQTIKMRRLTVLNSKSA